MPLRGKVVITCAVTGSIHTPDDELPSAAHAGRDRPRWRSRRRRRGRRSCICMPAIRRIGRPTPDPDVFMQFLPRIKQSTDAVVNITTGGGHGMSLEEGLAAPLRAKPEMCSLNMGSMNFGLFPLLEKYKEFRYPGSRSTSK